MQETLALRGRVQTGQAGSGAIGVSRRAANVGKPKDIARPTRFKPRLIPHG